MKIRINSINYDGSVVDGPGVRAVVYVQGCDRRCEGCHNQSTWDVECGQVYEVSDLVSELKEKVANRKLTISGGEPLFQYEAVLELVQALDGFDICLYTSSDYYEVERDCRPILMYLKYIKVGKYKKELRCTTVPYIGSTNQSFYRLEGGKIVND